MDLEVAGFKIKSVGGKKRDQTGTIQDSTITIIMNNLFMESSFEILNMKNNNVRKFHYYSKN